MKKTAKSALSTEYTVPFTVRSYEVTANGVVTLSNICNYFQEAAGIHADYLNFDINQLQEKGLTWVLYKMQVKVQRYPKRWDKVLVRTKPSAGDGIRAFRDYELLDNNENRLAAAVSQWMVLNTKTKRPVRIPDEILNLGFSSDNHVIEPDTKSLKVLQADNAKFTTTSGYHDLDMNNHVNNVTYIDWFTGYIPEERISGLTCHKIHIQYIAECGAGDAIYQTLQYSETEDGLKIVHTLFKNDRYQPVAAAITNWSRTPYSSPQS